MKKRGRDTAISIMSPRVLYLLYIRLFLKEESPHCSFSLSSSLLKFTELTIIVLIKELIVREWPKILIIAFSKQILIMDS